MSAVESILDDEPSLKDEYSKLRPIAQSVVNWQMGWLRKAYKHQIEPAGDWWNIWLILAGRGAGKTRAAAETLLSWAWEEPNTRWLVSAPTSGDLRGTCFEGDSGLLAVIPKELIAENGYNKSLHELKLINGSFIKGIPASEPERFRGPQFHGAWLDEVAAWDYIQESWDMIQFGIRLGTRTRVIVSTTPKPKALIMDLLGREGDDVVVTKASTHVNLENLAPSFQKQILQYEGTKLGQQEIYAELIDPESSGIVKREWFKMWPDGKPFPKFEYIIQSYDCATSDKTYNDPTGSITFGVFKPMDGGMTVLILDCWQEHLQYPDLRPKVISEYEVVYGEGRDRKLVDLVLVEDKSAGISLIQDLQRAHIPVHAYNPGRADKIQRLSIVANIIKAGRVWVPESSKNKGFVRDWAEGMVSQICSFPEGTEHDEFVDCFVSGTLIRMGDGSQKPIEHMQAGDIVATPFGHKPVVSAWCSGIHPVYEVTAGDRSLVGTPNHPFMVNDKWTAMDKLHPLSDTVYFYQGEIKWPSNQQGFVLRALRSMDTSITGTRTPSRKHIEITIPDQAHSYIAQCGSFITAPFLKVIKCITSMAMVATTQLKTLCVLRSKNIEPNTLSYTGLTSSECILLASEIRLPHGISPQKVLSGTSTMPSNAQKKPISQSVSMAINKSHTSVSGVGLKDLRTTLGKSSALLGVNLPSQASALVRQVRNTHTMQKVFNLEVGEVNCYFANDILVHNCISQGLRYLRDAGWISIDAPPRDEILQEDILDADIYNARHRENPYSA